MNKAVIIVSILLLFLVFAQAASAVSIDQYWEDGSSEHRTYQQGDVFDFVYVTLGQSTEYITTEIFLIESDNFAAPLQVLENTTQQGSYSDTLTYDTSDLVEGQYTFYGRASVVGSSLYAFDLLNFSVEGQQNTAPYWDETVATSYSYNLAQYSYVAVVNLSEAFVDDENDSLSFSLDQSMTNQNVVFCAIIADEILVCELNNVGTTDVRVTAYDGKLYSSPETITIDVYDSTTTNTKPYWNTSVTQFYTYNINTTMSPVFVLDLNTAFLDDEQEVLSFDLDDSMTNDSVVDCWLAAGSVLICDLVGVGQTTLDVFAFDGSLYSAPATITIEVTQDSQANQPPYFYDVTPLEYEQLGVKDVFDFELHVKDPEDDLLTFEYHATSSTDVISTCAVITDHILRCAIVGYGETTLTISASDPTHTVYQNLSVQVIDTTSNTAPYWGFTSSTYSYWLGLQQVEVLTLDDIAHDDENDSLSFSLDQSYTNTSVVDCWLQEENSIQQEETAPADTDNLFSSQTTTVTKLYCNLNAVGTTTVDLYVFDGQLQSAPLRLTINVWDDNTTTNTAPYANDVNTELTYWIGLQQVQVYNLSQVFVDDENDPLTFVLDQSMTDPFVVDCEIVFDELLVCDLIGIGTTKLDVYAYDGELFSSALTLAITVWNNETNNTPPYFSDDLQLYYSYHIDMSEVDVVDLADYAFDEDDDLLYYFLDQSLTNLSVANCSLRSGESGFLVSDMTSSDERVVEAIREFVKKAFDRIRGVIGPQPTTPPVTEDLPTDSLVHCDLNAVGTTTVQAIVFDGEFFDFATLTINVYDDEDYAQPIAVISAPGVVHTDELVYFDGLQSFVDPALYLTDYKWELQTSSGVLVTSLNGPEQTYEFVQEGTYALSLTIVDSIGQMDTDTHLFTVLGDGQEKDTAPEDGLKIHEYAVYGFDFELAHPGEDLVIFADVENVAGQDLQGIRMIFTLPEFGIRYKSGAFDLDDGDRDTVTIHGFVPEYIEPGFYYPFYEFSDNEIRRVKTGQLEIRG